MIDRRCFLSGLLGILVGPLALEAQPPTKIYRLGLIGGGWPATGGPLVAVFRQGLRDLGWLDGQNIVIEPRWGEGRTEELPRLASELIALPVDVVGAGGPPGVHALQPATTTIPIV